MAEIPTIGMGPGEERATPFVPQVMPPPSAFPGAVGASIEERGVEAGKIAYEEHVKTAEMQSLELETQYMRLLSEKVYSTKTGLSSLSGKEALAAADGIKADIDTAREQLASSVNSRYGYRLVMNATLRHFHYAQDYIDRYVGQQRRAADKEATQNFAFKMAEQVANVAAARGGYDPDAAQKLLNSAQVEFYKASARLDLTQEEADDFVNKRMAPLVDGMIGTLAHRKDLPPGVAAAEFEKWRNHMSSAKIQSVESALKEGAGMNDAAQIVYSAPRLNFSRKGEPDKDGPLDEAWVHDVLTKMEPARRAVAAKAVEQLITEENKNYDRARKARIAQVMADGRTVDGTFVIDRQKSSDELAWLERSAPGGPGNPPGLRELEALEKKDAKKSEDADNDQSLKLLRANLIKKATNDPENFLKMTKTDLYAETLSDEYPGFSTKGQIAAEKMLKDLQQSPKMQLIQKIPTHVTKTLEQVFPGKGGDVQTRKQYEPELISELGEAITASKEPWSDTDVEKFIHHAFDKKATPGVIFGNYWPNYKYLIDARMEERKKEGGGRLPIKIQRNNRGEIRVIYGTD